MPPAFQVGLGTQLLQGFSDASAAGLLSLGRSLGSDLRVRSWGHRVENAPPFVLIQHPVPRLEIQKS